MSNKLSMIQPISSRPGARGAHIADAPLVYAGRALADRGQIGFVWIDPEFIVTARYGPLVSFVGIGDRVTDAVPALVGLEGDILKLQDEAGTVLELPAVAMISGKDGNPPRLNLLLLWIEDQASYLCLAMPTGIGSEFELDLAREIRRRLIAETELKAKSRQLARANQDLEDYASVIAHDLKSPMRALRYQIDDLEKRLGEHGSPVVSGELEKLRRQARRMSNMLTALFDYSSAGRKTDVVCEVDTRKLVTSVIASLRPGNHGDILVSGTWPTFSTLEQPLDLVLRNLIDNAIKHYKGNESLRIQLHGVDHDTRFEFTITDNGSGIDPKHERTIFLPFRTVRPVEDDDVRGLGLALVRRSVAAVDGDITVEARGDGAPGAVFRVIWPKHTAPGS